MLIKNDMELKEHTTNKGDKTMNKEQLVKDIQQIEDKLADMKRQVEEWDKEIELEGGEFFIDNSGLIHESSSTSGCRYFGTERKTRQLAERVMDEMRLSNRLRARRDEIEPNWVADWNYYTAHKYYVYFSHEENRWCIGCVRTYQNIGAVYMSKQTAEQICEELNSGRFKL